MQNQTKKPPQRAWAIIPVAERIVKLITAGTLSLGLIACGEEPAPAQGTAAGHDTHNHGTHGEHGTDGNHGSHGSHGSHGDHGTHGSHGDHGTHGEGSGVGTDSAQGPGDQTGDAFDPSVPGSAPPAPGPIDCNALVSNGIEVGNVAPNFTLLDGHGNPVRLHDYCNHVVFLLSGTMSCTH